MFFVICETSWWPAKRFPPDFALEPAVTGDQKFITSWGAAGAGYNHTRWGPPDINWFINHEITPSNYSYIYYKATEIRQRFTLSTGGPILYPHFRKPGLNPRAPEHRASCGRICLSLHAEFLVGEKSKSPYPPSVGLPKIWIEC